MSPPTEHGPSSVRVTAGPAVLAGDLTIPPHARGIVVSAHGSGSSRLSARNRFVAGELQRSGLATLLLDLLTPEEETIDESTRHLRFDIPLLAERLESAVRFVGREPATQALPIGCFGGSTGAAAAMIAAASLPEVVRAVVSRGGRPDLAGPSLVRVEAPALLIVGGNDHQVIELNQYAASQLRGIKAVKIVPGASHLFEEPGALEEVARLARDWFLLHLAPPEDRFRARET
jgi:putative phosphoribosyl transferase